MRQLTILAPTSERLIDGSSLGIASFFPAFDFDEQRVLPRHASILTLPGKRSDLHCAHLQPACMLPGAAEDNPTQQSSPSTDSALVLEAPAKAGIRVVYNQADAPGGAIDVLQVALKGGETPRQDRCSVTPTLRPPPLGSTATNKLAVPACTYSWSRRTGAFGRIGNDARLLHSSWVGFWPASDRA